jgi:hypothetical protein
MFDLARSSQQPDPTRQPGERPAGYRSEDKGLRGEPAGIRAGDSNAGLSGRESSG